MKHIFDPTQETFEEFLRRISIGPWSSDNDVIYLDHGHTEKRWKTEVKDKSFRHDQTIHVDCPLHED